MITKVSALIRPFITTFNFLAPFGDLIARIWVAQIFFMSGLTKVQSWQSTMMLFTHVYHVPLLSPYVAAVMGTAAELILPVLLVLGFGGRFMIFIFFCYNAICAISYPFLWTSEGAAGLAQHVNWGILLMLMMFHGSGAISLDNLIHKMHGHHLIHPKKRSRA
jgi:putative oxidoreductase